MFNYKKIMCCALSSATIVGLGTVPSNAINENIDLQGNNRFETANKIALNYFKSPENIILVNSDAISDALSVAPYAKKLNAPVLLSKSDDLDKKTKETLEKLNPKNIVLIGGEKSLSENLKNKLDKKYNVERISGNNRIDTSMQIAKKMGQTLNDAFIVNGYTGLADAAGAGGIAAKLNSPLIFTDKNINNYKDVMKKTNIKSAFLIGGEYNLPKNFDDVVKSERIAGSNRNETNSKLIEKFLNKDSKMAFIAKDGSNNEGELIDSVTIGGVAGLKNMPVFLGSKTIGVNNNQLELLKKINPTDIIGVGGGNLESGKKMKKTLPNTKFHIEGLYDSNSSGSSSGGSSSSSSSSGGSSNVVDDKEKKTLNIEEVKSIQNLILKDNIESTKDSTIIIDSSDYENFDFKVDTSKLSKIDSSNDEDNILKYQFNKNDLLTSLNTILDITNVDSIQFASTKTNYVGKEISTSKDSEFIPLKEDSLNQSFRKASDIEIAANHKGIINSPGLDGKSVKIIAHCTSDEGSFDRNFIVNFTELSEDYMDNKNIEDVNNIHFDVVINKINNNESSKDYLSLKRENNTITCSIKKDSLAKEECMNMLDELVDSAFIDSITLGNDKTYTFDENKKLFSSSKYKESILFKKAITESLGCQELILKDSNGDIDSSKLRNKSMNITLNSHSDEGSFSQIITIVFK